jgi:hypothetical protein
MTKHLPKRYKPFYLNEIIFAIRDAIRTFSRGHFASATPIIAPKRRHGSETLPPRRRESQPPACGLDSRAFNERQRPLGHSKGRRFHGAL